MHLQLASSLPPVFGRAKCRDLTGRFYVTLRTVIATTLGVPSQCTCLDLARLGTANGVYYREKVSDFEEREIT